jgi:hypothetical protein
MKKALIISFIFISAIINGQTHPGIIASSAHISSQPQTILVTSITVHSSTGATTIPTNGGTLQMTTKVLPTNATDTAIVWSETEGTGHATLNSSGLMTAISNGTATARATANDGSGIYGYKQITISNQTSCNQNLVMYSEQFDNETWFGSADVTITADQALDLEGNNTMESVSTSDGSCAVYYLNGGNHVQLTGGTTYRFSFDVKRGTLTEMKWSVYDWTHGADIIAPTSYYSQTSTSVQRVSVQFTTPSGATDIGIYFLRDPGATGNAYFGRAQVETNGSCYIETTTSIITP